MIKRKIFYLLKLGKSREPKADKDPIGILRNHLEEGSRNSLAGGKSSSGKIAENIHLNRLD